MVLATIGVVWSLYEMEVLNDVELPWLCEGIVVLFRRIVFSLWILCVCVCVALDAFETRACR